MPGGGGEVGAIWGHLGWFGVVWGVSTRLRPKRGHRQGGKCEELSSIGQQPLTRHRGNHRVLGDRKKPAGKYQVPQSPSTSVGHPKVPPQVLGAPKPLHKYWAPQSPSTRTRCTKAPLQVPGAPKLLHSHRVPQNLSTATRCLKTLPQPPQNPMSSPEQDTLRSTRPPPQAWHMAAISSSS